MREDIAADRLELVRTKADQWAKALIDLDRRNTLLNFRETKTGCLPFTDCDTAAMSRLFAGQKIGLRALFPDAERHHDACKRARALRRRIVGFSEEQGIEAGRIACGLIRVTPQGSPSNRSLALRAPLLLRPFEIHAKTAAESDFTVQAATEVEVNPVLLYAFQSEYGLEFDADELEGKINTMIAELVEPAEQVERAHNELNLIAQDQGPLPLELERVVAAGLFNYQKLPMVQDLQRATELLAAHDLVAAVAGDAGAIDATRSAADGDLAPEVDAVDPADEYLVHDANSSQHHAIDLALARRHLVVEGPPGTGKSQTIANLIASAAAKNMRVLFVAEKRAAIEAVTDRLAEVDLLDIVLDLHTTEGSRKKHLAQQVATSLARIPQERPLDVDTIHRQLRDRRTRLVSYVSELHRRRELWGLSAFDVREQLLRLDDRFANRCRFAGQQLAMLDAATAEAARERLREFAEAGGVRVLRDESPWSHCEVEDIEDARRIMWQLDDLAGNTLHSSTSRMQQLVGHVGLPVPADIAHWQEVLALLDQVATSVSAFGPDIFGQRLDAMWYATAPRAVRAKYSQQLPWRERRALAKAARQMCRTGIKRKPDLHQALTHIVSQRNHWWHLAGPGSQPMPVAGLETMMADYTKLRQQLTAVAMSARVEPLENRPTPEVHRTLDELRADRDLVFRLPEINKVRRWFGQLGLTDLLSAIAERDASAEEAAGMFMHSWLSSLEDEFRFTSPTLREFTAERHDRFVAEFQDADIEHRRCAARRVRRKVALDVRDTVNTFPDQADLLKREARKKSRHLAVRKLVERAPDVLLALRPCWAMSPLVVSQTLPPERLFDLVIFDEASQIKPHDAITSIMRGDTVVIAGDEKQLPPTTFFERDLAADEEAEDEDTNLGDYESILTSLSPIIPHGYRLQWHYRSQDERLIAFSNKEMYEGDLVTFPGARRESPVRLELVDGSVSPGQDGLAAEEVGRVVELVIEHAERRPEESLGVITLNVKHQARVDKALRDALAERRDLDDFFDDDAGPMRRFFVKNIETVQGDERDAIILSVGVARNATGTVPLTAFGVLNQEGTERRVNVAVTRAKRRMTVVASFPPGAISPSARLTGTEMLRRYLEAAFRAGDPAGVGRATDREPNGFELDIERRLIGRGITVHRQWGVSDYCIDLALAHPDEPGRMVLAVEADGDTYHRAHSARDRDRLRQEQLERLGWRFHRVWASAWFADPEKETDRIVAPWRAAVDGPSSEPERRSRGIRRPQQAASQARGESRAGTAPGVEHNGDRGPRPRVLPGLGIDEYPRNHLIAIARWCIADGLPLDRDSRIHQVMAELGFQRRGKKIVERVGEAVDIAQQLADTEER